VALAGESGVYETTISAPLTTEKRSHSANALVTRRVSSFAHRKQRRAIHQQNKPYTRYPRDTDGSIERSSAADRRSRTQSRIFSARVYDSPIRFAIRNDPLECGKRGNRTAVSRCAETTHSYGDTSGFVRRDRDEIIVSLYGAP